MQDKRVQDVYSSYFHFNNERTLSTDLASELFTSKTQRYSVFVDTTRKYDNQIIVHDICSHESLDTQLNPVKVICLNPTPEALTEAQRKYKDASSKYVHFITLAPIELIGANMD